MSATPCTGDPIAVSFFGSLLIAWRRQLPGALPEERAHTFDRAVEAIGQDASDPIGRLLVERRALEHTIGLGKGRGTSLV